MYDCRINQSKLWPITRHLWICGLDEIHGLGDALLHALLDVPPLLVREVSVRVPGARARVVLQNRGVQAARLEEKFSEKYRGPQNTGVNTGITGVIPVLQE